MRNYANIATAIWRNDDFRALTGAAQRMYLLLTTQPDISAAGVLPLRVRLWSTRAKDTTTKDVTDALHELQAHRFIVFDIDTEELLVRSFVRWDGGFRNPKRMPVIRRAAQAVESEVIRTALAKEFVRLELPREWVDELSTEAANPVDNVFSQVNSLSASLPGTVSATVSACESPSDGVVVTQGLHVEAPTHNPQPPPQPAPAKKATSKARSDRGTRLPEDWTPGEALLAWAKQKYPNVDLDEETEKFRNHWLAKTGKDASKRDWDRTWQNWIMEENSRQQRRWPLNPPFRSNVDTVAVKRIPEQDRCRKPGHESCPAHNCAMCRSEQLVNR